MFASPLWVPAVLMAAFFQNLRSLLQKQLSSQLSTGGATLSRFLFAFPLALAYACILSAVKGAWPEAIPHAFPFYVAAGAFFQVVATYALLASFHHGAFAVGNAYSKTEALQAVVIGAIILGEFLSLLAILAILVGIAGVSMIAFKRREDGLMALDFRDKAVWYGLASGAMFATASVCFRGAALSFETLDPFVRAGWTLTVAVGLQTVVLSAFLAWREPGQVMRTVRAWRTTGFVAVVGVTASIGWHTAFSLQTVALVKALAQIELVFSTITSWAYFKEPVSLRDVAGIALIGLSVIMIVLVA
ncbi:MAG: DMT family transporter [Pseudomonadota bacterium]